MTFNDRELEIINTALFDLMLYVEQNPESEYVAESNGLADSDTTDFNYSVKEIRSLYEKVAY
jgi:hypothetical protein